MSCSPPHPNIPRGLKAQSSNLYDMRLPGSVFEGASDMHVGAPVSTASADFLDCQPKASEQLQDQIHAT